MQKQKTKTNFIFTLTIITFTGLIIIGYLGTAEAYPTPEPPKHVEAVEGYPEKFCDLDVVICPNEEKGIVREVTAYNVGDPNQTDKSPCIGAYGDNICELLEKGECIVASNAYKKNTILEIQNIGKCRVLDRMNSRYKNRIDIAMPVDEKERAIKFGIQKLTVSFL